MARAQLNDLREAVENLNKAVDEEAGTDMQLLAAVAELTSGGSASEARALAAAGGIIPRVISIIRRDGSSAATISKAVRVLLHLSRSRDLRDVIREEGGVDQLCRQVGTTDIAYWNDEYAHLVDSVICTLVNLCNLNPTNRDAVRKCGGLTRICTLLIVNSQHYTLAFSGTASPPNKQQRNLILERTVFAVCTFIHGTNLSKDTVREAGGITPLVRLLSHERANVRSAVVCCAAQALRMLAFRHENNREALRLGGAIPPLLKLLAAGPENPVTLHATATFAAMATGNSTNKDEMCRAGCIPALVGLMMVGHERPVARIATSAIMALCYQHPGNRRAVREAGGIQPLIRLLAVSPPHPITEKAAWALSNLCAGCSPNQEEFCAQGGLTMLAHLLHLPSSSHTIAAAATPELVSAIAKAAAAVVCNLTDHPAKYMAVGTGMVPPLVDIANGKSSAAPKARLALRCLAHKCPMIAENIINCGAGHHLRATTENASAVSGPTALPSAIEDSTPTFAQKTSIMPPQVSEQKYVASNSSGSICRTGSSRITTIRESWKKGFSNLSLSFSSSGPNRDRPLSAISRAEAECKGYFRLESGASTSSTFTLHDPSPSSTISSGHDKDQSGSFEGIKKSLRVMNPLRRSSCGNDESQAQKQSIASSSARPMLLIPDEDKTLRHLSYVESPPSAFDQNNTVVQNSMSSHGPSRGQPLHVECPSPTTPHLKRSGYRASDELLADTGVRKYHTDSSSDEEISRIHQRSQGESVTEVHGLGSMRPTRSSKHLPVDMPPSPSDMGSGSVVSQAESEGAGAGDYQDNFGMGCEDVDNYTHFSDTYCGEGNQFEEASKRSLEERSLTSNSFIQSSKNNFSSIISEMNPAALIFATGAWGRMQDVDSTLF